MITKRIVFTNPDGSVGVLIPTGEIPVSEVMQKDVPAAATNTRLTDVTALPADRLFRGAWDDSNPEEFIGLNLTKAQEIAHEIRRADRETKLAPLDKEVTFAGTSSARKTAINVERTDILSVNAQIQTDIDNCANETSLRAVLSGAGII